MTTKRFNPRGQHLNDVFNAYGLAASYLKDALRETEDKKHDGDVDAGAAYHLLVHKCREVVAVIERAMNTELAKMRTENIWEDTNGAS